MRKEYESRRRRPLLAPVWLTGLAGLLFLAGAIWIYSAATTTTILVMRHAEKAELPAGDPALSPMGEARAERLAQLLGGGPPETRLQGILVTEFRRTQQTARPLANRLSIPVIVVPGGDVRATAARALDEFGGGRVLIIGHSDTVPALVERLSGHAVPVIAESEYGAIYLIARPRFGRAAVTRLDLPL